MLVCSHTCTHKYRYILMCVVMPLTLSRFDPLQRPAFTRYLALIIRFEICHSYLALTHFTLTIFMIYYARLIAVFTLIYLKVIL